jgi:hypothetical protein
MRFFLVILYGICAIPLLADDVLDQELAWTWLYEKRFLAEEQEKNKEKTELQFSKYELPAFSQLVFSWNSFRSCEGYFSFWAQARDAQTKSWGTWHKMAEWGAGVQRSYLSRDCSKTSYHHVRLEMKTGHTGDAFRIRIVAHNSADLSLMKAIAVSSSDFTKFKQESLQELDNLATSIYLKDVPKQSQMALMHEDNTKMCSPTSCSMLIGYLTDMKINPIDFAQNSYDGGLEAYGSWPFNTAHAFELCGGAIFFAAARLSSFRALYKKLQAGIPVVVSVRGEIDGAPKAYNNGHLLIVVGWNARKKHVICHDPAFADDEQTVRQYPVEDFLRAWERSHRLAYLADPIQFL